MPNGADAGLRGTAEPRNDVAAKQRGGETARRRNSAAAKRRGSETLRQRNPGAAKREDLDSDLERSYVRIIDLACQDRDVMPLAFSIDADARLIMLEATGALTAGDVITVRELIRRDPRFDPNYGTLWDLRRANEIAISDDVVMSLASSPVIEPRSPRAFVVQSEPQARMARLYRQFGGRKRLSVDIFAELDDALAWCQRVTHEIEPNATEQRPLGEVEL